MGKTTNVVCLVTEGMKIIAYAQGFNKGRDGNAMNPYYRDDQRVLARIWISGWMDAAGCRNKTANS